MLPVHSKVLEPKDVQEANGPARVLHILGWGLVNRGVDLVHDPHEEPPVDPLRGRAARQPGAQPHPPGDGRAGGPLWPCSSPFHGTACSLKLPTLYSNCFLCPKHPFSLKRSYSFFKAPPRNLPQPHSLGRSPPVDAHFSIYLLSPHQL